MDIENYIKKVYSKKMNKIYIFGRMITHNLLNLYSKNNYLNYSMEVKEKVVSILLYIIVHYLIVFFSSHS